MSDFFLQGATTPRPTNLTGGGYICPVGHFCRPGALKEVACNPGTYSPTTGLGACLACPEGFACSGYGTVHPQSCPAGHYCLNGSSTSFGNACPQGTYQPKQNKTKLEDCLPCPAGKFCNDTGLVAPAGDCFAGYLCVANERVPNPASALCPVGHYCLVGAVNATMCPPGTVRKTPGGASRNDCMPCDPGYFCSVSGLSRPSGLCKEGFFCPEEVEVKFPNPSAHPCPSGYYCGNGTSVPKGCPPGTYQPSISQATCLPCPAGKLCRGNTSIPEPCPAHTYCLNSTIVPIYCPNGTFTYPNETGLYSPTQCRACIPGHYCQRGIIAGPCSGGYICLRGSPDPWPKDPRHGEICPIGFYCPAGALDKVKCPRGLVITTTGRANISDCQRCSPGFICTDDNTVPQPCGSGFYCPYNLDRIPCRIGTYNNYSNAEDESYCKPCPAGYWCRKNGEENLFFLCYHAYNLIF